jgi:hypothetical protein
VSTEVILKKIKRALEPHGIDVAVQKAITTTSVYVKLDNGALKSIRIGDHSGKRKYHYGYEIGTHVKNYHEFFGEWDGKVYVRIRFPADQIDALVEAVRLERTNKILKYGEAKYAQVKKTGSWT